MERPLLIHSSLAPAAGTCLIASAQQSLAAARSLVNEYRRLGRTGLKRSDILFGDGAVANSSMIGQTLGQGINWFNTAPDYGDSETLDVELVRAGRSGTGEQAPAESQYAGTF